MTTTFEASFRNVEAVEDRIVSPRGEVFGLSRFKTRNVKILVLDDVEPHHPAIGGTISFGGGMEQQKLPCEQCICSVDETITEDDQ